MSRNVWKSKRDKQRLHARFSILERVSLVVDAQDNGLAKSQGSVDEITIKNDSLSAISNCKVGVASFHEEDSSMAAIKKILHNVSVGSASFFSLSRLSKEHDILSQPVPAMFLSTYKITTLCMSRFGKDHTEKVLTYVKALETCTPMEYATILGEYRVLSCLLLGGFDLTKKGKFKKTSEASCPNLILEDGTLTSSRHQMISVKVLKNFFQKNPLTLKCYVFKRLVDMRIDGYIHSSLGCANNNVCAICNECQSDEHKPLLYFGKSCGHLFCELCFWEDMINCIDEREGNVVLCLICKSSHSEGDVCVSKWDQLTPSERYKLSLSKYNALPDDIIALKALPKKSGKKNMLCSSWSEAVKSSLGSSKDIRLDKFFFHTERNALHYVRGCLEEGIDINSTNEYGLSALHIAAWRGYCKLVVLLLKFGCDVFMCANGGIDARTIAQGNRSSDILNILEEHICSCKNPGPTSAKDMFLSSIELHSRNQNTHKHHTKAKMLIQLTSCHPGAGAFIIDHFLSQGAIDSLVQLWCSLPIGQSDKKRSKVLCSDRSYYCDATGKLCNMISSAMQQNAVLKGLQMEQCIVFPHMRFLHYGQEGIVLAPHIDLARVNIVGQRSTHTFILYLYDCLNGGETSLLGDVSGEKRNQVLAKVKPCKGRMLVFPHKCPHEGNKVIDTPKVLLRGELLLGICD